MDSSLLLVLRVIGALLVVAGAVFLVLDGFAAAPVVMVLGGAAALLTSYTGASEGTGTERSSR